MIIVPEVAVTTSAKTFAKTPRFMLKKLRRLVRAGNKNGEWSSYKGPNVANIAFGFWTIGIRSFNPIFGITLPIIGRVRITYL